MDAPVRTYERLTISGFRRGMLAEKWGQVIRQDIINFQLNEDLTLDRKICRPRVTAEG